MNTEAIVNYIFRDKFDSSSLIKENIIETLAKEKETTNESVYYQKSNINKILYQIESQLLTYKQLHRRKKKEGEEIKRRIEELSGSLSTKILDTKQLLSTAMLAERQLTGETYTSIPPLTKEYATDRTDATIRDNIVMGIKQGVLKGEEFINIPSINISGEDSTDLTINSKNFPYILTVENRIKTYSQIKVVIPPIVRSGVFNIKFEQPQVISVLNQYSYEIVQKHITKELSIPVDDGIDSIKIRFHNKNKQQIKILSATYTDKIYLDEVVFETKKFNIDETFSQVTVGTCDNYVDQNVDIQYYVSLNGKEYIQFRPTNKIKNLKTSNILPSIVNTDSYDLNEIIKISESVFGDNVFKFKVDDLRISANKLKAFERKLGESFYSMSQHYLKNENIYSFITHTAQPYTLRLNSGQTIEVNGEVISATENKVVEISRGINEIKISKQLWKEPINLIKSRILEINNSYLLIEDRESKEISKIDYIFNILQAESNSIYLQLLQQNVEVYMKEIELKKRISKDTFIEYFYKDNVEPIYLASYQRQVEIKTLQIKAIMKSIDKRTCPFISRIIIRGV